MELSRVQPSRGIKRQDIVYRYQSGDPFGLLCAAHAFDRIEKQNETALPTRNETGVTPLFLKESDHLLQQPPVKKGF